MTYIDRDVRYPAETKYRKVFKVLETPSVHAFVSFTKFPFFFVLFFFSHHLQYTITIYFSIICFIPNFSKMFQNTSI